MTEEELEKIRQAKRDKRKREKEGKKKKKEEEKRLALMAPKTSKIKMISADVLQRMLRLYINSMIFIPILTFLCNHSSSNTALLYLELLRCSQN